MANPAAENRSYYLGVGGAQSGPHPESEVLQKIKAGVVSPETLIWYEGLPEWQPASSVAALKAAFAPVPKPAAITPPMVPVKPKDVFAGAAKNSSDDRESLVEMSEVGEPVFAKDEAIFDHSPWVRKRPQMLALSAGSIVLVLYLGTQLISHFLLPAKVKPRPAEKRSKEYGVRETKLREAMSTLNIHPEISLSVLSLLVKEDVKDAVGKEALAVSVDYYRRNQTPNLAAQLYLAAKKPREAAQMFMLDPAYTHEAEMAYWSAYETSPSKGPQEKDILLKDVQLLLGPLRDFETAKQRIMVFEKDFPNEPHAFKYYLKPTEEKLEDIFSRISFYFVNSLLNYLQFELPQIVLAKRPLIQLVREKDGRFRIIGIYDGDVLLNQDKLNKIRFVFWLNRGEWNIVETNLTKERKIHAVTVKEKLTNESISSEQMLSDLETVFRQQFPKNGLHETVLPPSDKKERPQTY